MSNGSPSDITGLSADAIAELERLLAAEGMDAGDAQGIPPRDPSAPTPASFSQELLWMLDRASPGLTAYNIPMAHRLRGPLDVAALERALSTVVARHEALRSRFADGEGHPVQVVDPPAPIALRRVDLSGVPAEDRERLALQEVTERARTPIDLAREAPFRATLVRLADDDHALLIESHHIALDGVSTSIIFRELGAAYAAARAGRGADLPPVPLQVGDVAAWERQRLAGPRGEELLAFWREQLGSAAREPLDLPTDYPRPSTPTFSGARESLILPAAQVAAIRQFAQANQATLYMMLLAGFATVLHRYTGRSDVLVGSGSAGRSHPETAGVVGYLNTTLVQRADYAGDPTLIELLGRVRASAVAAYDHQDIPLEKLVLELRQGQERLSHAPLFEVVLTMLDVGGEALALDGLTVEQFGVKMGATKFDITLFATDLPDGGLALMTQHRSDLFAPQTMRRLLGHIARVLDTMVARPDIRVSRVPLLGDEERAELAAWNRTEADEGPAGTVVSLFERQAARVPDVTAVVGADGSLTYAELNARANGVAARLRAAGVGAGATVGLALDRSARAIVGLLGILKAGAAYVPLPPDVPTARRVEQLRESGAAAVVAGGAPVDGFPPTVPVVPVDGDAEAANPAPAATPDDLAYVLFTSGSTGVPKGVAVTHTNVVHYARAVSRVLAGGPGGVAGWTLGMVSTLGADLGGTSLWPALLGGGTLHLLGKDVATEPARFAEYVAAHPLDVLKITPNHLHALVAGKSGAELAAVLPRQWIVTGGEALRPDLARTLLGAGTCRVLNHYGPTETTVGVLTNEVTAESLAAAEALGAQTVPLGRPLANTHARVVDGNLVDVPVSIPGELLIGGAGVARGYHERDDLTAEKFVTFDGRRVYRTGDRVRRLADGTIEFLGRADDQVKVRGYRVELGEVEQALRAHPGVEQAVAALRDGDLVAYVVPKGAGYAVSHSDRPTPEKLAEWVAARLPEYMVPGAVVLLDALPLTPNGKVDRAALPAPQAEAGAAGGYVEPRTDAERTLAAIWAEVLKKERVGATDNFLDLGGHSLLAIRVLGKIGKAFGLRLPLRTLFEAPTVAQLAELIELETQLAALDGLAGEPRGR